MLFPGITSAPALLEVIRTYDRTRGVYREADGSTDTASTELEVCQFWYWLILMVKPRQILETGTYRGYQHAFSQQHSETAGSPVR